MIVVTIDLHSAVTGEITRLGKLIIANDGTGTRSRGNYVSRIFGRRNRHVPVRTAEVKDWPRLRKSVFSLLKQVLVNARY